MEKSLELFDSPTRNNRPEHSRRMLLRSEQKWLEQIWRLPACLTGIPQEESI
jgi:hypothetical protein